MTKIFQISVLLVLFISLRVFGQQKANGGLDKLEDKALTMIDKLPELAKADRYYQKHSHSKKHLLTMVAGKPGKGQKYFNIEIAEDNGAAYHTWYSFLVDPRTGEILYEDYKNDKDIPLNKWRKQKNYLGLD